MKIIDITQPLFNSKVYDGDISPSYKLVSTVKESNYNISEIKFNVHNGTHIDAPYHCIDSSLGIGEMDLSIFYGDCSVYKYNNNIDYILSKCKERLLFKDYIDINIELANKIVNSNVKLIGVEAQTVGDKDYIYQVHKIFLEKNIVILEGLVLKNVEEGNYILSAFPLNLGKLDASPVRAILISL